MGFMLAMPILDGQHKVRKGGKGSDGKTPDQCSAKENYPAKHKNNLPLGATANNWRDVAKRVISWPALQSDGLVV
jgi:hypothetical protein